MDNLNMDFRDKKSEWKAYELGKQSTFWEFEILYTLFYLVLSQFFQLFGLIKFRV